MESASIGEVARSAGARPSALRYYESVGLLPRPERANGRRRYGGELLREVLRRLTVVRVAKQAGFTISEIRTLLDGFAEDVPPSERWRVLAQDKLLEVEALVERALGMKNLLERGLRCECLSMDDCALVGKGRLRLTHVVGVAALYSSSSWKGPSRRPSSPGCSPPAHPL